MKIIYNKLIPFKGYFAIMIFGAIFIRDCNKGRLVSATTIRHESIHVAQAMDFCKWKPLGFTLFYLFYFLEWIFRLIQQPFTHKGAYERISFEREAYDNQGVTRYLDNRKRFSFLKYF